MRPLGTVVAFGEAPMRDVATLDATALACQILPADFRALKQAEAGALLLLLCEAADDPALAAATKAARILRLRGGGEVLLVLPPLPANPGPQVLALIERAAAMTFACALQPVGTSWADAVRCFIEPLAVFGLAGCASWTRRRARQQSSARRRGWWWQAPKWQPTTGHERWSLRCSRTSPTA